MNLHKTLLFYVHRSIHKMQFESFLKHFFHSLSLNAITQTRKINFMHSREGVNHVD